MIAMFSFARSGSTMVLDFLSKLLGFSRLFEPLMQEPEKIKGHPDFAEVHDLFRGGPGEHTLHNYKIGDFYMGHIPEAAFGSDAVAPYKEKLKSYLGDICRLVGENTVVKFVRQQGNIPFFHAVMSELNIRPGYILLKRNPYEIAYSYYRMGGFRRRSTWGVDRLYHYREHLYRGESERLDAMFDAVRRPLDKLVAAILADYRAFDVSARWLQDKGIRVLRLAYEDFIQDTPQCCRQLSTLFDIPVNDETIQLTMERFKMDAFKVASGQADPIYSHLALKSRQRMAPWLSQFRLDPTARSGETSVRLRHVKFLLKNVLPFVKVS
jgi:hypothetical protein